jgi:cytochrome c-type biogenesis protein
MDTQSLGLFVAFTAGLLSFLSPCVLPLVPSYATFITGMSLDELRTVENPGARRSVMLHGLLFVLGFSAVFMMLGASATFLGSMMFYASPWVERVGGVLLILFGLYLLGWLRLPGADREWRLHLSNKPMGYMGTLAGGRHLRCRVDAVHRPGAGRHPDARRHARHAQRGDGAPRRVLGWGSPSRSCWRRC